MLFITCLVIVIIDPIDFVLIVLIPIRISSLTPRTLVPHSVCPTMTKALRQRYASASILVGTNIWIDIVLFSGVTRSAFPFSLLFFSSLSSHDPTC